LNASASSPLRCEIKAVCQEAAYERLLMILRMDPAGLRPLFPTRRVQSVYLDTPCGRALQENLAGVSRREKVRVRWYGDEASGVAAVLERKVRENSLGWKETLRLAEPLDVEGVRRTDFVRRLRALATPEWRADLDRGLEPVQWITYLRDYMRTADGRVRVTLDRRLAAADQRLAFRLSRKRATPLPRVAVVEAKCAAADLDAAQELLSRLPLFVDRCSKFVLASDREHGPVSSILPS
jgi:hypothetical protein